MEEVKRENSRQEQALPRDGSIPKDAATVPNMHESLDLFGCWQDGLPMQERNRAAS